MSRQPLAGVRVLDLSRALAGPFCAQVLSDLGAEVVKLEQPGPGDDMRHWTPLHEGTSTYFMIANRNKRSVAVDLKAPEGGEVLRRLVAAADVVIENFPPAVARRLGVDHAALQAVNPDVVVCSIRSYEEGPHADRPAYDAAIQAMAGIMSVTGEADGPPTRVGLAFVDYATGLYAAVGVLAALLERRPAHVETSLMSTATAFMSLQLVSHLMTGHEFARLGTAHPTTAPSAVFPTATDDVLVVAGNERQWRALAAALGHEEWTDDPRFATNGERVLHRAELAALVREALQQASAADWAGRLEAHGVPYAPVRTVAQVAADPETRRTMLVEVDGVTLVGSPLALDGDRGSVRSGPPALGRDTVAVLQDLGYDAAAIARLLAGGAVAGPQEEP